MRIIELRCENFKRLTAVAIRPDRSVMRITGENGHGKSSLLDSIFAALGGAANHPSAPIRIGADRASIRLDLGEGEDVELSVIRRFTAGGTSLQVEANGAVFKSPQAMLDKMIGQLSFDPLAFARQPAKAQVEQLRGIVQVDVDLDALDAQAATTYEQRTDIGRRLKSAMERANMLERGIDPKAEVDPIDVSALLRQLEEAGVRNTALQRERDDRTHRAGRVLQLREDAIGFREQAALFVAKAEAAEADAINEGSYLDALTVPAEPIDTTVLREGIERAQQENADRVKEQAARTSYGKAIDEAAAFKVDYDLATETIELCQRTKEEAIARAQMPIPGLSFGDGEITFNDVPFSQASSAEQIKVATAIGMALNPKIRILSIRDGSLLDSASMAALHAMAEANNFQVWCEVVATGGDVGIEIIDGSVAYVDGVQVQDDTEVAEAVGA